MYSFMNGFCHDLIVFVYGLAIFSYLFFGFLLCNLCLVVYYITKLIWGILVRKFMNCKSRPYRKPDSEADLNLNQPKEGIV